MGFLSRLFGKKEEETTIEERTVMNIQVGDIITYDLEDYQVVGNLTYTVRGYKWQAYQLQSEGSSIWLSVEMDDELELGIYKTVKEKVSKPIPKELTIDGVVYYQDEHGHANVSGKGRGSNVNGQEVEYYDFSNEEESEFLSIEIWGTEVEVSKGYEVEEYEIKILAGSK
ncbi:DUF4178 domain-containing protein [Pseudalkalibacillus hwajinpoensis]|uniref:DUF4178 domain-containing protein n=1 Tax=Guptibacillus hwajinpoensis TaxID=208199 RepID=A0A4U1MAU6_9BACL|nr:DUF4178 domain-containing protein [Pseudalkalibacillus hwajinpoensis]TKD67927.1 DUF4178 domain-containing protein [Pseudalkalibacillus hwajinpoensis]